MLGRGALGQVYKAIDLYTNKEFALKFVKYKNENDANFKTLLREIELLRKINDDYEDNENDFFA